MGCFKCLFRENASVVAVGVLHSIVDDVESVDLVRECRERDEWFGMKVVDEVLNGGEWVDMKAVKKNSEPRYDKTMEIRVERTPLVATVEQKCGLLKLYGSTLEKGWKHSAGLKAFSQVIIHHWRAKNTCSL